MWSADALAHLLQIMFALYDTYCPSDASVFQKTERDWFPFIFAQYEGHLSDCCCYKCLLLCKTICTLTLQAPTDITQTGFSRTLDLHGHQTFTIWKFALVT